MHIFLLLSLVFFSSNLQARTEGRFLGMQYMINIISAGVDGTFEHTPARIYEQMNVPEQQSMLGPGKALELSKKEMTFICNKKAENNYHCSIMIFKSAAGSFDLQSAQIKYTGEQAKALVAQFFPNKDGSDINITDDSGKFNLVVKPDLFQLTFSNH